MSPLEEIVSVEVPEGVLLVAAGGSLGRWDAGAAARGAPAREPVRVIRFYEQLAPQSFFAVDDYVARIPRARLIHNLAEQALDAVEGAL